MSNAPPYGDHGRRRAIVHIGTHKTGTTSFQAWVRRYRRVLAARTGIHFYDGLFNREQYELAVLSLRPDRIPENRRQDVESYGEEEVRAHVRWQVDRPVDTILCSAEELSFARDIDEVERLVDLLYPRDISIVVVLREPAEFLRSYTAEFSRKGLERSPDPASIRYVEPDSWLVRYEDLLGVYGAVLGPQHVTAISYEDSVKQDGSIIPAILRACGADTTGLPSWEGLWQHQSRTSKEERERVRQWWRDQKQNPT